MSGGNIKEFLLGQLVVVVLVVIVCLSVVYGLYRLGSWIFGI